MEWYIFFPRNFTTQLLNGRCAIGIKHSNWTYLYKYLIIFDSLLQWASLEFPLVLVFSHEKSLRFCLIANHSFLQTLLTKYSKTHHNILLCNLIIHLGTDLLLLIEQLSEPFAFVTLLELILLACKIILSFMDCITEHILRFHITKQIKYLL